MPSIWNINHITHAMTAIKNHLRAIIALDKAAILYSTRITIITVTPIIVGALTGQLMLGVMSFLSALYVTLADVGGAYHNRAIAMGSAAILMTITAFIATIVGGTPWLVTALMFAWAFIGSMAGVYGNLASKVSFSVIGIFILLMGQPASMHDAWLRVLAFMLGGAWAIGLSLWIWPLRPFQPARQAVGDYYLSLATLLRKVSRVKQARYWSEEVKYERASMLEAHDRANQITVARRTQREDANPVQQRLLMLTLRADSLMETIIALAEELALAREQAHFPTKYSALASALEQGARLLEQLAYNIIDERQTIYPASFESALNALAAQELLLREMLPQLEQDHSTLVNVRNLCDLLKRASRIILDARELLAQYDTARYPLATSQGSEQFRLAFSWHQLSRLIQDKMAHLKANLTPRSLTFRHALRLGILTAAGVAFVKLLQIPYGYWIPLTVLFILKPDYVSTRERGFQRALGTVIGGVLGTLLVAILHGPILLFPVLVLLGFFCFAHQNSNHTLFIQFLTPFVVLMIDLGTPGDWLVAMIRIGNTLVGAGLALLACYMFWPQWETERLPQQLRRAIAANRTYISHVLAAYTTDGDHQAKRESIRQAGKVAHLENANTMAAFQRLLSEPKTTRADVELFYTLVAYSQRVCDSATSLAAHTSTPPRPDHFQGLMRFSWQIEQMLQDIEETTGTGTANRNDPALQESLRDILASSRHLIATYQQELSTNSEEKNVQTGRSSMERQRYRFPRRAIGMHGA